MTFRSIITSSDRDSNAAEYPHCRLCFQETLINLTQVSLKFTQIIADSFDVAHLFEMDDVKTSAVPQF